MRVKFGLGLGVADVNENIKNAVFAEKCGFDGVWMADHIGGLITSELWGEAWTTLTAIAMKTKRLRLYCAVTDPLRRHPAQTAQTVATLDRISNGRVGVGIGAGESMNLLHFGLDWRTEPLLRLREATEAIKLLLESSPAKPVKYDGKYFQLKDAFLHIKPVQKPRPPVFIGALGPKNRELVGEIADGWCSWFQSLKTLKKGIEDIRRGAERVGRKLEDIKIALSVPFAISDKPEEAWEAIQEGTKLCLVFERNVLRSMGYTEPFSKDLAIQWGLLSQSFTERLNKAKELVPREAVEAVAAFGNVDTAIEKIEERVKLGVDWIIVNNYGPKYDKTLEIFKREIIPYFSQ